MYKYAFLQIQKMFDVCVNILHSRWHPSWACFRLHRREGVHLLCHANRCCSYGECVSDCMGENYSNYTMCSSLILVLTAFAFSNYKQFYNSKPGFLNQCEARVIPPPKKKAKLTKNKDLCSCI